MKSPEEVELLIQEFENEARKLGIYLEGHMIAGAHVHEMDMDHSEFDPSSGLAVDPEVPTDLVVVCTLMVGEQAFSDRILHPEKHAEDQEFREMTATVDPFQALKDEMERKLKDGEDPLG